MSFDPGLWMTVEVLGGGFMRGVPGLANRRSGVRGVVLLGRGWIAGEKPVHVPLTGERRKRVSGADQAMEAAG